MPKSENNGIELHGVVIPTAEVPYIPDDLWLKIFQYIDDPRRLAQNIRICKRFHKLLTHYDYIWSDPLRRIQEEYLRIITRGLDNAVMYLDFPKNAPNYQKVVSYGKTVHGYYVQVEKNKPKPKTKLEKIIGIYSVKENLLIAGTLTIFYLFFILLGLRLDKTADVPPGVLFLFVVLVSFIIMGATVAMTYNERAPRTREYLGHFFAIRFTAQTIIGLFTLAFNMLCLAILTLVYTQTGKASTGVWVFCGLGFGIMMFLLFTFQCRGSGLQYRYGMAFRIFMAVSFTCFCLGIVMLVYTQFNSRNSNSFGWSFAAWVFSYMILLFYLYFLALCFGTGFRSPKGCQFCFFGTAEALTGALFFATAVMCYLNIVSNQNLPWVKVFIPIYLLPLFVSLLCCSYRKTFEDSEAIFV